MYVQQDRTVEISTDKVTFIEVRTEMCHHLQAISMNSGKISD